MNLRDKWEERACKYQNKTRGVLFQGLPDSINEMIDQWHGAIVKSCVVKMLPAKAHIVDLGSGYGRMSDIIQRNIPDSMLVGLDFSCNYCQAYAAKYGSAICADIKKLPFLPNHWDGILVVTSLMYVEYAECKATVNEIIDMLKPGGVALFIDPGFELIKILRYVLNAIGKKTTGEEGFSQYSYLKLFENDKVIVVNKGGNVMFTMFLPILMLIHDKPVMIQFFCKLITSVDVYLKFYFKYSLHRWVLIRRV